MCRVGPEKGKLLQTSRTTLLFFPISFGLPSAPFIGESDRPTSYRSGLKITGRSSSSCGVCLCVCVRARPKPFCSFQLARFQFMVLFAPISCCCFISLNNPSFVFCSQATDSNSSNTLPNYHGTHQPFSAAESVTSKGALSGLKMDSLSVSLPFVFFLCCLSNHDESIHQGLFSLSLSLSYIYTHTQLEKVGLDFTLFLRIGVGSSPIQTNPSS